MEGFHIVALSPARNGFFDPISGVNLTRMNPQGLIPVGSPVSGSVRAALLSGGIIDIKGSLIEILRQENNFPLKEKAEPVIVTHRSATAAGSVKVDVPVEKEPKKEPVKEPEKEPEKEAEIVAEPEKEAAPAPAPKSNKKPKAE